MKLPMAAAISTVCLILDQMSKRWAQHHLTSAVYNPLPLGLLRLVLVTNTGGAFSFARGNNLALALLSSAIVIGILAWVVWRKKSGRPLNNIELCGVGFLIGGALGNLWDRIVLGYVIDFLDFAFIDFPVFNLSDVFVDTGIGLIVIGSLRRNTARR